ncbi:NADP-dependent oxidoreductase [Luethyella okanaganae]|uniref:NADP-dependent oxidoreductase n=1 Tax=Luethyella okanaganae TaxID=69372 RepID=A0ABW1VA29_9MICO
MPHAVKFSRYGGPEVLEVVEIAIPRPADGEVLVEVVAAGINPAESAIREGRLSERWVSRFPQGQGSDFAGFVSALGRGVTSFEVNDAVIGHTSRGSHASHLVVPATNLTPKPRRLPWEVAGSLFVVGTTAWAAVNAVGVKAGDVVVVSAAAGGVGCIAAQLARLRGATVIGTASPENFDFLRQLGVIPVAHGPGVVERIRAVTPHGVDAYLDTHGGDNIHTAVELGVSRYRINTIIDWEAIDEYGLNTMADADSEATEVLAKVAHLVAQHKLVVPVSDIFPLERVREAFVELDRGHTRGKIVLGMQPVNYRHQRVQAVDVKEAAVTVGVSTEHPHMDVYENLPPVIGHLPHQAHPHPSDTRRSEPADDPLDRPQDRDRVGLPLG